MDILHIVRQEAEQRFKSEAEVEGFMQGFEKQAFIDLEKQALFGSAARFTARAMHDVPSAIGKAGVGLGVGLLAAGLVAGINKGSSSLANNGLKSKFEFALTQVMTTNKIVKGTDPTKVKSYAQTLFNFAPHIASDANLLGPLLANVIQGEGIDSMTIKSITDLEGRYKDNQSIKPWNSVKI